MSLHVVDEELERQQVRALAQLQALVHASMEGVGGDQSVSGPLCTRAAAYKRIPTTKAKHPRPRTRGQQHVAWAVRRRGHREGGGGGGGLRGQARQAHVLHQEGPGGGRAAQHLF